MTWSQLDAKAFVEPAFTVCKLSLRLSLEPLQRAVVSGLAFRWAVPQPPSVSSWVIRWPGELGRRRRRQPWSRRGKISLTPP